LDGNSSCKLIFLDSKVPTPIAKKNTKDKILYGVFPISVKAGTNAIINNKPPIKTKIALAFEIPFLDARNKHTTTGNKNMTIKPSYLNCVKMLANAARTLVKSIDEVLSAVNVTGSDIICVSKRTKAMRMNAKYDETNKIFFLLGKSNNKIAIIVIGRNAAAIGCESTEAV